MYDLHLYNAAGLRIIKALPHLYMGLGLDMKFQLQFLAAGTYYLKVQIGQLHIQTLTLIKSQ
jgi:hypothetical protein